MKLEARWIVVVVLVFAQSISAADLTLQNITRDELTSYRNAIIRANAKTAQLGGVDFFVVNVAQQALIAVNAITWKQKRASVQMIKDTLADIEALCNHQITVLIKMTLRNKSDLKTSLKIPDDFKDYLFLENDQGEFVRASDAKLPMLKQVSVFNPQVAFEATFPLSLPEGQKPLITEATKTITLVVSGLSDAKDLRFKWAVPLPVPDPPAALVPILDMAKMGLLYSQKE